MAYEIERKWLVKELPVSLESYKSLEYVQGYLCTGPVVRVRREGSKYVLTYKGEGLIKREEYNLPLCRESFERLIKKCDGRIIKKQRYFIPLCRDCLVAELDIFREELSGLVTAEVEFSSEEEAMGFVPPAWFGREVSLCPEYKNSSLALSPDLPLFS